MSENQPPVITDAELQAELANLGATPSEPTQISSEQILSASDEEIQEELENIQKYGDRGLETAALSGAGSLTFGASSRILQGLGAYDKGEIAKLEEYNPKSALAGEITGLLGATIATGGTGTGAKVAGKTAAGLAERAGSAAEIALSKALKASSNKLLAKEVVRKSLEMGARGATEGAVLSVADLANENAIGNADFNAENLINYVGTGALTGGLTGAILPVAGSGIKGAYKGSKQLFDKAIAKSSGNATKDAVLLMGMKPKAAAELLSDESRKEFADGILPWMGKRLGIENIKSNEALLNKMIEVKNAAQKNADNIIEEIDTMLPNQPGLIAKRKQVFGEMAKSAEEFEAYQAKYGQDRALSGKLTDLKERFIQQAQTGTPIRLKDLRELRTVQDDAINYAKRSGDYGKIEQLAYKNRKMLSETMHDMAELVSPAKAGDLKQAFQDMHYSYEFIDNLGEKLATNKKDLIPSLMETLQAAGAIHLLGTPGGLIAGGLKFLNSDMKRRLNVISALKKANDTTEKHTISAVENFIASPKTFNKAATISALLNSSLALSDEKGKPKNKQEAYTNVAKKLSDLSADPIKLTDRTVTSTAMISQAAPLTATAASLAMVRGVQFLQSKIPKNPYLESLPGMKPRPYTPSSMELAKFDRYMQIIEKPLTVVNELEQGTLTREHVEALQAVYPAMYEFIRTTMINKMQDNGEIEMSYSKKIQASILLDLISDNSMIPHNIAALQANFQQPQQGPEGAAPMVQPTQGGTENIKQSEREASDTQAFMQRRSQP